MSGPLDQRLQSRMNDIKKYGDLATIVPLCCGCRSAADGTIVLAHRNRSGWGLPFGRGVKSLSICGAFLCHNCHTYGDNDGRKDYDWWELAVQRSITWAWGEGYLSFGPGCGEGVQALR